MPNPRGQREPKQWELPYLTVEPWPFNNYWGNNQNVNGRSGLLLCKATVHSLNSDQVKRHNIYPLYLNLRESSSTSPDKCISAEYIQLTGSLLEEICKEDLFVSYVRDLYFHRRYILEEIKWRDERVRTSLEAAGTETSIHEIGRQK